MMSQKVAFVDVNLYNLNLLKNQAIVNLNVLLMLSLLTTTYVNVLKLVLQSMLLKLMNAKRLAQQMLLKLEINVHALQEKANMLKNLTNANLLVLLMQRRMVMCVHALKQLESKIFINILKKLIHVQKIVQVMLRLTIIFAPVVNLVILCIFKMIKLVIVWLLVQLILL